MVSMSEERRWRGYMERFTVGDTGCWVWRGKCKQDSGYGIVHISGRDVRAHVAFYNKFVGEVPEGQELRHSCDNPPCVNPEHLVPGTHAENMKDMAERGRRKRTHCPRGHLLGSHVYADGSRCTICRSERSRRYEARLKAGVVVVVAMVSFVWQAPQQSGAASPPPPSQQFDPRIQAVQLILRSQGYALAVDGVNGPQTQRAVKHWQKANGLDADGIVGPVTWAAITAAAPAIVAAAAGPPSGLSDCDEMSWYRQQAGLPEVFDSIGYRESRCRNDVTSQTGCCSGWLQIAIGNRTAPGYREGFIACGVSRRSDFLGNSAEQKAGQMCVAKVLYLVSGMRPWAL